MIRYKALKPIRQKRFIMIECQYLVLDQPNFDGPAKLKILGGQTLLRPKYWKGNKKSLIPGIEIFDIVRVI